MTREFLEVELGEKTYLYFIALRPMTVANKQAEMVTVQAGDHVVLTDHMDLVVMALDEFELVFYGKEPAYEYESLRYKGHS